MLFPFEFENHIVYEMNLKKTCSLSYMMTYTFFAEDQYIFLHYTKFMTFLRVSYLTKSTGSNSDEIDDTLCY